ncbi:MAG TPA: MBL fold metallo-hydrolase [Gaiellaceae bacterium]|nr:MBL fold metallo-hydrolase [Gaiellaceae bacterium]
MFTPIAPGVELFHDTCNVYVLHDGGDAVLVDFGSGDVLEHLSKLGVSRLTDVLVTHHHRDQVQGLARAVDAGARVWVPPHEHELIAGVNARWEMRQLDNDYDLRQDRYSLLEQVPVAGVVAEYRTRAYGAVEAYVLPTPGHTVGSVTYLVERGGERLAFSGDLVHGDGKVWSLAATQWSYSGIEGLAATNFSCGVLAGHAPDRLLPSHGEPVDDPPSTLGRVRGRLEELARMRLEDPWRLGDMFDHPWAELSPHLLRNRTSFANSYALLSEEGGAVLIDFGYEVSTGLTPVTEHTARRPLLWAIEALKRDHGVRRVDAVVVTHYHDDHVAGLNLLREIEGTEVWAPANVAPILEEPHRYDLPCLWHEPIPVDRVLALEGSTSWQEYELAVYALPGHTRFAAAIGFEVDGRRVLATGDQQTTGGDTSILNYQYRNRYRVGDFVRSAELYRELRPDLLLGGHWPPTEVTDAYLDQLLADSQRLEDLHRELLPEEPELGAEGFVARIEPYRSTLRTNESLQLDVVVRNPFARSVAASVRLVVPAGWPQPEPELRELAAGAEETIGFLVTAGGAARRARVAADITLGETRFGQEAEALVDVE